MPSFLSPSPLTSLSHLWRVLVKGESGSKDALRCSMGWRMWSFHKTFDATFLSSFVENIQKGGETKCFPLIEESYDLVLVGAYPTQTFR
ncbi:hypothetical protein GTHT12_02823 [Geobacillus thermodenitrificans]|nr:hypothetical protein GTHT12_02823 [Geobacillus thermodenitrificans]